MYIDVKKFISRIFRPQDPAPKCIFEVKKQFFFSKHYAFQWSYAIVTLESGFVLAINFINYKKCINHYFNLIFCVFSPP